MERVGSDAARTASARPSIFGRSEKTGFAPLALVYESETANPTEMMDAVPAALTYSDRTAYGTGRGSVQSVAPATVVFAVARAMPSVGTELGNSVHTVATQVTGSPTSGPSSAAAAERTLDQLESLAIPRCPRSTLATACWAASGKSD